MDYTEPSGNVNSHSLDPRHLAELRASGLSDETIAAARIYSATAGQVTELLGCRYRNYDLNGMAFPYPDVDGNLNGYARVKPDRPRDRDGKSVKYESPLGRPSRAYFPPNFRALLASGKPLLITEGEKKCLAAAQAGWPCIGLVGVWGFQQKRLKTDTGRAFGERRLIPDMAALPWKGTQVVIVFDSDVADNPNIRLAEVRLAEVLAQAGADVRVARIPQTGDAKVGLDDFLVAGGDLDQLIADAKPPEKPEKPGPMDWAKALLNDRFTTPRGLILRWWCDEFYEWTGTHYRKIPASELRASVLEWLDQRTRATPKLATDVVVCLHPLVCVSSNVKPPVWLDGSGADRAGGANHVAFDNGILDISNVGGELTLRPHSPAWFALSSLPYAYDSNADCPAWQRFLNEVFDGDAERITLLQKWFGLLLTPITAYQKALLMVGPRRSGKGTIGREIRYVFGSDACASPALHSLTSDFGLWPLLGKTIAVMGDAHLSRRSDSVAVLERLKSIIGEDPVDVHRKNLPTLTDVRLGVRFVISVNELPMFNDPSGALAVRLCILPFRVSFAGREDRDLEAKLRAETPGVFNWALDGLFLLLREGFHEPAESRDLIASFGRLTSPVRAFVEDCCVAETLGAQGRKHETPCKTVWSAYAGWCDISGHKPAGEERFGEHLRNVNGMIRRTRPSINGTRTYVYDGLELTAEAQELAERYEARKGDAKREDGRTGWGRPGPS